VRGKLVLNDKEFDHAWNVLVLPAEVCVLHVYWCCNPSFFCRLRFQWELMIFKLPHRVQLCPP
jgi:hypothetical protein